MPSYLIVYEVQGWFGDQEWSEGLFRCEAAADRLCAELWKERRGRSVQRPAWAIGNCKFAVVERRVL